MLNKPNNQIVIFLTVVCLVSFSMIFVKIPAQNLLNNKNSQLKEKIYRLEPMIKSMHFAFREVNVDYSKIWMNGLINLNSLENITLRGSEFDNLNNYLYFAGKRIVEMEHKISQSVVDQKDFKNSLSNYSQYIKKELTLIPKFNDKEPVERYMSLIGYLKNHELKLTLALLNSRLSNEQRTILIKKSHQEFEKLQDQINRQILPYNPSELSYSLINIIDYQDFGLYRASYSVKGQPEYFYENSTLIHAKTTVPQQKLNGTDNNLIFKNVPIDGSTDHLILQLPNIFLPLKNLEWYEEKDPTSQLYRYQAIMPVIKEQIPYLFSLKYSIAQRTILQMEQFNPANNAQSHQYIFSEELLPVGDAVLFQKPVFFQQNTSNNYLISFISNLPITKEQLNQFNMELIPILDPEITLVKTASINQIKTNKVTDNYPLRNISVIIFLISLNVLFLIVIFRFLSSKINTKLIIEYAVRSCNKLYPLFLTLFIVIFLLDLLSDKSNPDWFYLLATICGLLTLIGMNIKNHLVFYTVLGFFTISILLSLLNLDAFSEKFSVWTFIFFIILLSLYIFQYYFDKKLNDKSL